MVLYETLVFIHQWLTEIKGTDDTEVQFGGLNIIAVGDFYQLPPVRDKFIFQNGRGYVPGSTHSIAQLSLLMHKMQVCIRKMMVNSVLIQ